jgi:hypothetical protein
MRPERAILLMMGRAAAIVGVDLEEVNGPHVIESNFLRIAYQVLGGLVPYEDIPRIAMMLGEMSVEAVDSIVEADPEDRAGALLGIMLQACGFGAALKCEEPEGAVRG